MPSTNGENAHLGNAQGLRRGHTTGTCAAAASKAAALALITGEPQARVSIRTPRGIVLDLPVEDPSTMGDVSRCAVRKDGGDDADVTHGSLVYAEVRRTDSGVNIDGGTGVGRVTRKGLDQPVGNAAINSVPRSMIREALEDVMECTGYKGGLDVVVSIPDGVDLASRTFNPRLGIVGGISVLGTSGIVEPMSETALVKTIHTEMNVRAAEGDRILVVVPGNYGKEFVDGLPGIDPESPVKCSNFVGEMLDHACELGTDILLVSNMGKMVKLAGGIMNTHSRNGDCRMEIVASNLAMVGGDIGAVREVMGCVSTDDALDIVAGTGLMGELCSLLMEKIEYSMNHRTGGRIRTGAVMFSSTYGLLGKTSLADELLEEFLEASQ